MINLHWWKGYNDNFCPRGPYRLRYAPEHNLIEDGKDHYPPHPSSATSDELCFLTLRSAIPKTYCTLPSGGGPEDEEGQVRKVNENSNRQLLQLELLKSRRDQTKECVCFGPTICKRIKQTRIHLPNRKCIIDQVYENQWCHRMNVQPSMTLFSQKQKI